MATQNKFSRRTIALFGLIIISILIGSLIAYEQIALLYALATAALVVLLLIVGFADLEKVDRNNISGFSANE